MYQPITDAPVSSTSEAVTQWLEDNGGWGLGRMQIDFSIHVLQAEAANVVGGGAGENLKGADRHPVNGATYAALWAAFDAKAQPLHEFPIDLAAYALAPGDAR